MATPSRAAKTFTWIFSKLVNVAMFVAGTFDKAERGDLAILDFELLAISNFVDMQTSRAIKEAVDEIKKYQKSMLLNLPG